MKTMFFRLTATICYTMQNRCQKMALSEMQASHLPELESFVTGVEIDKAAVLAGLTLPWSNDLLEGHVNRLKLLKRNMDGRARLPLLRSRVLHVAEKEPSRVAIPMPLRLFL